ncbi:MAG: hypothetical protein CSYNP_04086 [Syntrophus sp. SKADARSKE-3]|nr:hypothetical protein [Syntrophus sp. SKADARSKE-3]
MNAQRIGIMSSLVVHIGFLSLLFIFPAASLTSIKTFQISFERQETFSKGSTEISNSAVTPWQKQMRNARRQEVATQLQEHNDSNTQMAVAASIPILSVNNTVEIASAAKNELKRTVASGDTDSKITGNPANIGKSLAGNVGKAAVVETKFGDIDAPQFIYRELPIYPKMARRMEKEGKVVLLLFIDPMGKVLNIDVIEHAAYGFTEAAITAIKKSSFAPARWKGGNVASRAILSIRFNLE